MQWHDHRLCWPTFAKANGASLDNPYKAVVRTIASLKREALPGWQNTAAQLLNEAYWLDAGRPYYNLYPSVASSFFKIDLKEIKCRDISLPLEDLLIRLPVGKELQLSNRTKARSIMVGGGNDNKGRAWIFTIDDGGSMSSPFGDLPIHHVLGVRMDDDRSIDDHLQIGRNKPYAPQHDTDQEASENAVRLVVALCLLKDDPDFIRAEPLEADRAKWEATHDPKYIEKAIRRGKRGWAVGADIQVAPGYRRAHFAIRWCGQGRTDARLRPIKSCIVHRKIVEELPTGYAGFEPGEG